MKSRIYLRPPRPFIPRPRRRIPISEIDITLFIDIRDTATLGESQSFVLAGGVLLSVVVSDTATLGESQSFLPFGERTRFYTSSI